MKKFDRAMYAIFLLALLADVARSRVPAPGGQDSIGGLILSAANQLRVAPDGGAALAVRRANSSFPAIPGFRSYRSALATWARSLSGQKMGTNPIILAAMTPGTLAGFASAFVPTTEPVSPSLAIFKHTGSPAP